MNPRTKAPLLAARRNAPRLARPLAPLLPHPAAPSRPVFLLGCPRSGTSLLFKLFRQSSELGSLADEGHAFWEAFHHPAKHGWDSNALHASDVTTAERRYLYRAIQLVSRRRRFLEKTPKNCLRVPYLAELFPDASFVFLRRRAAANVNSLLEGWRAHPRYVTYRLPSRLEGPGIPGGGRDWSFALTPGWRDLRRASLEQICAHQYVVCNEAVLEARDSIDPERWIDLSYEDLLARPVEETTRVFGRLGLTLDDRVAEYAAGLARKPINTVTPPKAGKWREQNPREISAILPFVAATERLLGYEVETR